MRHLTPVALVLAIVSAVAAASPPAASQPVTHAAYPATRPAETTINQLATSLPKELRPSPDETSTKSQSRTQWLAANVAGKVVRQKITISSSFSPRDRTIVVGSPIAVSWFGQQATLGVSADVMAENAAPLVTAKVGSAITIVGTVRSMTMDTGGHYSVQIDDAKVSH
jgi:hypothetical protein